MNQYNKSIVINALKKIQQSDEVSFFRLVEKESLF